MTINEAIDRLRQRQVVPLFATGIWDRDLDFALRDAKVEELFHGLEIRDPHMAACAVAGLHLWNDNFTLSHNLCQGINTPTGGYWHGLCHCREGHEGQGLEHNLWNANYWFKQVGTHPAYDAVYRSALHVLDSGGANFPWITEAANTLRSRKGWDPALFIEWVGQADAQTLTTQAQVVLEEIQWREMDLLVDWCIRQAVEQP